jgi:hypothetical protein
VSVEALAYCLVFNLGGGYAVVRYGHWSPAPPRHDNPDEERRLYPLWRRVRRWVGLTGPQLYEKYRRRDLEDCAAELVATLDQRQESYAPPSCDDGRKWIPNCPDRLDAARLPKLQERITAARIDRDIAEFFRAPDQLGAGNDEKRAMEDFQRQFVRDEETFKVLNSPVPHLPSPSELIKKFYSGGGSAGGDNLGGRSIAL